MVGTYDCAEIEENRAARDAVTIVLGFERGLKIEYSFCLVMWLLWSFCGMGTAVSPFTSSFVSGTVDSGELASLIGIWVMVGIHLSCAVAAQKDEIERRAIYEVEDGQRLYLHWGLRSL